MSIDEAYMKIIENIDKGRGLLCSGVVCPDCPFRGPERCDMEKKVKSGAKYKERVKEYCLDMLGEIEEGGKNMFGIIKTKECTNKLDALVKVGMFSLAGLNHIIGDRTMCVLICDKSGIIDTVPIDGLKWKFGPSSTIELFSIDKVLENPSEFFDGIVSSGPIDVVIDGKTVQVDVSIIFELVESGEIKIGV